MPRILTYNVQRCIGGDRVLDVGRVCDVIAALTPDIVALQELDVGHARTGGVDQAQEIALRLGMAFRFHPARRRVDEHFGDAILTAHPERLIRAGALPGHPRFTRLETRGAIWVEAQITGRPLQVITTHLGLVPGEQMIQASALLGSGWLGDLRCTAPVVLLGDFNVLPHSRVYRALTRDLIAARTLSHDVRRSPTFPALLPVLSIDHIFVSPGIRVTDVFAPRDALSRLASDHLPLVMDFELDGIERSVGD